MKRFLKLFLVLIFTLLIRCDRKAENLQPIILFTGAVTDINQNGAVFSGNFKNINPSRPGQFGFVWGIDPNLPFETSTKFYCKFEKNKEVYTYTNSASLKIGLTYYMRTFATDQINTYFGNTVSFVSLGSKPSELKEVQPSAGCFGDTVLIKGNAFGMDQSEMSVMFNGEQATILSTSDQFVRVIVPNFSVWNPYFTSRTIDITVTKFGVTSYLLKAFQIIPPVINFCSITEGLSYSDFIIKGRGFHPRLAKLKVGQYDCKIVDILPNSIHALLPPLFTDLTDSLSVEVDNKKTKYRLIKIKAPKVNSIIPGIVYSYDKLYITGSNLLNLKLAVAINGVNAKIVDQGEDRITVEVNGGLCATDFPVELAFDQNKYTIADKIKFRQPENVEILNYTQNYYDGYFIVKGNYFPEISYASQDFMLYLNGTPVNGFFTYNNTGKSSIQIYMPASFTAPSGKLSLDIHFCGNESYLVDTALLIPAPLITSIPDVMYAGANTKITGFNLNASNGLNQIFINGTLISTVRADSYQSLQFNIPMDFPEGTFPFKIVTNGQVSNILTVTVKHRWEKIADVPFPLGGWPVAFYANGIFYVGGGEYPDNTTFYSYNLNSKIWQVRSSLPTKMGVCANDLTNGYLSYNNHLYQYNFSSNQWSGLPDLNMSFSQIASTYTGFLNNNNFYIIPSCPGNDYAVYNITNKNWTIAKSYSGTLEGCYTPYSVVKGNVAYIFDGYECVTFDMTNNQWAYNGHTYFWSNSYQSPEGFEYNNSFYFYGWNGWGVYSESDLSVRYIDGVGTGYYWKAFHDGDYAYLITNNSIWRFNLTMQ